MDVVIGCDPSSKKVAFIVTVGDSEPRPFTHLMKMQDVGERCASAYEWVEAWFKHNRAMWGGNVYFFIEDPVVGRGGAYATIAQSKVHGAIVAAAHRSGVCTSIRGVNNSHAKKKVVGKGNANKDDIKAWCRTYWNQAYVVANNGKDQDLLDAAMHNRYGAGVVQTMTRIEKKKALAKKPRPLRRVPKPTTTLRRKKK